MCPLFIQIFIKINFKLLLCQDLNTNNIQVGHKRTVQNLFSLYSYQKHSKKVHRKNIFCYFDL